jgi:enoyl-CoA hydratase/carnithine racemase
MNDRGLTYRIHDAVATLTINRPERKNAFTLDLIDDWAAALVEAARDDAVRVVVLTGSGDAFCAGIDLDVLAGIEPTALARKQMLSHGVHQVARAVGALDKPLIAAINGVAVGAGLDMALMCDLRFAATSARMSEGYIKLGLVPGDGGCWLLPRLVGVSKALELLLSGDFVDAAEAMRIGMVNRVFDDGDLMDRTYEFAARLASHSPTAVSVIKRTTYQSASLSLATSLDLISSHMAIIQSSPDFTEAMDARRDARTPSFEQQW